MLKTYKLLVTINHPNFGYLTQTTYERSDSYVNAIKTLREWYQKELKSEVLSITKIQPNVSRET